MTRAAATPGTKLRLDALRALLAERGWNWARLAEHSGIPLSSIVRLRDGDMQLTGQTIAQLLHVFPRVEFKHLFDDGREPVATAVEDDPQGTAA
jgi:plasmid maintenance system antidote protein VapI